MQAKAKRRTFDTFDGPEGSGPLSITLSKRSASKGDIKWSRFELALSKRTYIMGILNRTPDSFSDGGLFMD